MKVLVFLIFIVAKVQLYVTNTKRFGEVIVDGVTELKESFLKLDGMVERIYGEFLKRGLTIGDIEDLKDEFIENLSTYDVLNENSALYRYSLRVGDSTYCTIYSDLVQKDFESWLCDQKFVDAFISMGHICIHAKAYEGTYDDFDGSLEEWSDRRFSRLIDFKSTRLKVSSVMSIRDGRDAYEKLFNDFVMLKLRNEFYRHFKLKKVSWLKNMIYSYRYQVYDFNECIETFKNPKIELDRMYSGDNMYLYTFANLLLFLERFLIKEDLKVVK